MLGSIRKRLIAGRKSRSVGGFSIATRLAKNSKKKHSGRLCLTLRWRYVQLNPLPVKYHFIADRSVGLYEAEHAANDPWPRESVVTLDLSV